MSWFVPCFLFNTDSYSTGNGEPWSVRAAFRNSGVDLLVKQKMKKLVFSYYEYAIIPSQSGFCKISLADEHRFLRESDGFFYQELRLITEAKN